ncbi:MAG TPA: TIGR00282 family metallophosphoesterase [Candidatus Fimenecus excrementavium]|nr:TIGR00282 family metallophosphoesterase [Candidatus Fimenecus excrementavium]
MNNTFWNLLFIGDVVAQAGCDKLKAALPALKREKQIDICIANGENSAQGNGMTPDSAEQLFSAGVDFITGGNHTFRRREIYGYLDNSLSVCRPANYKSDCPGRGFAVLDKGFVRVGVVNVLGTVYLEPLCNPFDCVDEAIAALSDEADFIVVDFHAEATAEKRAMGFYLDGRVAAVVGTHTHVQTADAQILENGTAYITDLGMTGPKRSVLGVTPELAIEKMRTQMPVRFQNPAGECCLQGLLVQVDKRTRRAVSVEPISL